MLRTKTRNLSDLIAEAIGHLETFKRTSPNKGLDRLIAVYQTCAIRIRNLEMERDDNRPPVDQVALQLLPGVIQEGELTDATEQAQEAFRRAQAFVEVRRLS